MVSIPLLRPGVREVYASHPMNVKLRAAEQDDFVLQRLGCREEQGRSSHRTPEAEPLAGGAAGRRAGVV